MATKRSGPEVQEKDASQKKKTKAEQFETTIQAIKAKLNGLRTQFGREMFGRVKSAQNVQQIKLKCWMKILDGLHPA